MYFTNLGPTTMSTNKETGSFTIHCHAGVEKQRRLRSRNEEYLKQTASSTCYSRTKCNNVVHSSNVVQDSRHALLRILQIILFY